MSTPSIHVPVLPRETVSELACSPGDIILDGTFGGGGHARMLNEKVAPEGRIIGIDRDPAVLDRFETDDSPASITLLLGSYADAPELLDAIGVERVNGIVLDLGLSSDQLEDRDRGFSFTSEGDLDLRFDPTSGEPAWRLLQRLSAEHLANLIYEFGEERLSRRIARKVVEQRRSAPIRSASQLAAVVRSCYPRQRNEKIDPATRTFQALRIAVNDELRMLEIGLRRLPGLLHQGGRMVVISFHSLEDRMVKQAFRSDERLKVTHKKPLIAQEDEVNSNPRSRSAKLRVAEKIE